MTALYAVNGGGHVAESSPVREGDWTGPWMASCTTCGVKTYPLTNFEADMWVAGHDTALRPKGTAPPAEDGSYLTAVPRG